jgi:hypothetical protein
MRPASNSNNDIKKGLFKKPFFSYFNFSIHALKRTE